MTAIMIPSIIILTSFALLQHIMTGCEQWLLSLYLVGAACTQWKI